MIRGFYFLILIFAVSLVNCRPDSLSEKALRDYVLDPENGLKKDKVEGDLAVGMLYRPKELVILQEVGAEDQTAWGREVTRLDSVDYFVLTLSKGGKSLENFYSGNPARSAAVSGYLSDGVAADLSLNIGSKRSTPLAIASLQGFGGSDASSILVVFKVGLDYQNANKFSILFNGAAQALGRYQFEFDLNDIKSIPQLKKV